MANQYSSKFPERFWEKVNKTNSCWLWIAGTDGCGYGMIAYDKKTWRAHRLSYLMHFGNFDLSLYVAHKCDTPNCVNPQHLFLASQKENMEDMVSKNRSHGSSKDTLSYDEWLSIRPNKTKKDLCKRGHYFSQENTRIKKMCNRFTRNCRTCQYEISRTDQVVYKVKGFVRGVKNRQEVVQGLIDKVYSLGVICIYCGGKFECLDHYIPKKNGGEISIKNINPACNSCNQNRKKLF